MFPTKAENLPLHKIADYWSRDRILNATKQELQAKLEEAWLCGDLVATNSQVRLGLLRYLYKAKSSHFRFLPHNLKSTQKEKVFRDGSVEFDPRSRIPVPDRKPTEWTDETCKEAYAALATFMALENTRGVTVLDDVVPNIVKPALHSLSVRREDFFKWLKKEGYHQPDFWTGQAFVETLKPASKKSGLSKKTAIQMIENQFGPFSETKLVPSQDDAVKFFATQGRSGHRGIIRDAIKHLKQKHSQPTGAGRPKNTSKSAA